MSDRDNMPFPRPGSGQWLRRPGLALVLGALAAVAASVSAIVIALTNSGSTQLTAANASYVGLKAMLHASGSAGTTGMSGPTAGTGNPMSWLPGAPSNPNKLAGYLGRELRGNGQYSVSLKRTEALSDQRPRGAEVDLGARTIRFTTKRVRLVIVASPPNADMKFRAAGINDPTIELPAGSRISIEFINGDNDEAHMWLLQAGDSGPANWGGGSSGGAHVMAAPPMGDPTSAGQQGETISFQAPAPGNYHYSCPFPGHAAMGMYGHLTVER